VLIVGQLLGTCAYTGASDRRWRARIDRPALILLATDVAFDKDLEPLNPEHLKG
jgi:hypothetical protein